MNYIRHYGVSPYSTELKQILEEKYGIKCTVLHNYYLNRDVRLIFDLDESNPRFQEILRFIPDITPDEELNAVVHTPEIETPVTTALFFPSYTEEERQNTKWLQIRPMTTKVDPVNDERLCKVTCIFGRNRFNVDLGRHKEQANPYEIKRPVKWGNSQFFSAALIGASSLFCDDRAKIIMDNAKLRGLRYGPVLKWKAGTIIPNIHQILPDHVIPDGAFVPIRDMVDYRCDMCGMQMLRVTGPCSLYGIRDCCMDPEIDFYQTLPLFLGKQRDEPVFAIPHYIISQRAYQVLRENKMCRGVEFTPLTLK